MRERANELERAQASIETTVAEKLVAERQRIAGEEAVKAKQRVAGDLDAKAKALTELQGVLKEHEVKLAEAQKAQAEFMRKERALEEARREMELTILEAGFRGP